LCKAIQSTALGGEKREGEREREEMSNPEYAIGMEEKE
jgi:hypothetical protein